MPQTHLDSKKSLMQSAHRSICQDGSTLMIRRCQDSSSACVEKYLKQIITSREMPLSQHLPETEEQWVKRESKWEVVINSSISHVGSLGI